MFSLMIPDRHPTPVAAPESPTRVPATPEQAAAMDAAAAEAPDDWPKDVHLPDEEEEEEC